MFDGRAADVLKAGQGCFMTEQAALWVPVRTFLQQFAPAIHIPPGTA